MMWTFRSDAMRDVAVSLLVWFASVGFVAAQAPQPTMTVAEMAAALASNPQGDDATRLADSLRTAFGGRNALLRGLPPKIDELTVAWAIELAEPLPEGVPRP